MTWKNAVSAVRMTIVLAILGGIGVAWNVAVAQDYAASIVEMHDSSVAVPIGPKGSLDVLSERSTIVYRQSDLGKSNALPTIMTFQGDVVVRNESGVIFQSDWLSYDTSTRFFEAVEVHVHGLGKAGISLACSGGELFINGEGTGTFPTEQNPRTDLIPNASVSCSGSMLRMVFRVSFQEP